MSSLSKIIKRNIEAELYGMASFGTEDTGLPCVIFISPKMGKHDPRIKIGKKFLTLKVIIISQFLFLIIQRLKQEEYF